MAEKYLAHRIIHQGQVHTMALLTISCDSGRFAIDIEPFTRETAGTSFHNGSIIVCSRQCAPEEALHPQNYFYDGPKAPLLIFTDQTH